MGGGGDPPASGPLCRPAPTLQGLELKDRSFHMWTLLVAGRNQGFYACGPGPFPRRGAALGWRPQGWGVGGRKAQGGWKAAGPLCRPAPRRPASTSACRQPEFRVHGYQDLWLLGYLNLNKTLVGLPPRWPSPTSPSHPPRGPTSEAPLRPSSRAGALNVRRLSCALLDSAVLPRI